MDACMLNLSLHNRKFSSYLSTCLSFFFSLTIFRDVQFVALWLRWIYKFHGPLASELEICVPVDTVIFAFFVAISCNELDITSFRIYFFYFFYFNILHFLFFPMLNLAGKAAQPTNRQLWAWLRTLSSPRLQDLGRNTQHMRFKISPWTWWVMINY